MQFPKCRVILLFAILLSAFLPLRAQQNSEITGMVTDPSGNVIVGAKVTITEGSTGYTRTATTDNTGLFTFPGLNVGTYSLQVTATGFQNYTSNGIVLNVSRTLRQDVHMTVGAAAESVTVQADALTVQTDSNVVSSLISSDQIAHIATENRNFAALAALGLGVSSALPDNNTPTSVAANFTISINGLRQSHNIWLIDGGEADDRGGAGGMDIMPSQDAIAEFQTLTSNYPPEYGISSGATITLAFKSGGQRYHGELWEFNRNTVFDANNYFNKTQTPVVPRQKLNYNIFGGNVGGPLLPFWQHPHKTFFFWNEEWRRLIQGSTPTLVNTLPAGDFPSAGQNLHYVAPAFASGNVIKVPNVGDPAFNAKLAADHLVPGQPFPNQTIPANLFDPNALLYFASGVIPHPSNGNDQVVSQAETPINVRDDIVRIDHQLTSKWQLMGHYEHNAVTQGNAAPMLGWLWASYNTVTSVLSNPSNSALIKLSGTINPNLLVEAGINYDGNIIDITNSPNSLLPSGWGVNTFFSNGSKSLPGITGFGSPYNTAEDMGSAPWHNAAQDYDPKVDISWTKGPHAFKFGFGYNRYTKNQQLFGDPEGDFSFSALSGDGMMDMLMGIAGSYSQFQALPIRHYVNQTTSFYGSDNWHTTKNLSLQLGFRYDALPHAWERSNAVANFNPAAYDPNAAPAWLCAANQNAVCPGSLSNGAMDPAGPGFANVDNTPFYLNGMQIAGHNGTPRGLVKNYWMTWQPRVGFSWDITGRGTSVLRGGAGTFYERMQGNDIYNAATNPPFANNPKASNVYMTDPHRSWVSGSTATTPSFPLGMTNLDPYYPAPAVAQYSLGYQQQLAPSLIWVVQYVGNTAWHQNIQRPINNYPLNTDMNIRCDAGDGGNNYPGDVCPNGSAPTSLSNPDAYRTFQGYSGITQEENTTNGTYNGFQTGLRAQGKHGLTGEIDYTWSHEIDITSYDLNTVSNPWDLKYDKGSGALDRRHILSANYVYSLPILANNKGLLGSLLGGWQVAGVVTAESGTLIANQGPGLSLSYDPVGLGGGYTNRPNVSAKPKYTKTAKQWFDTSVFSAPVPVWLGGADEGFGNARKDIALGPGRFNFDTSLYKTFKIHESTNFEFRAESFNTFNHTEFNSIGSAFGSGTFGQPTTTWDPRVLQFGGKLNF